MAGTGSGFKSKSSWNYGFLAGVRQLRDEDEAGNMIMGKTKVPGSLNYVAQAWRQFGDQGGNPAAGQLGNSGYEDVPQHWAKVPEASKIREGTDGCVNGTNVNWDYEMGRKEMTGRMRAQMKIHKVDDGYDGCVGESNPMTIKRVGDNGKRRDAGEVIGSFLLGGREARTAARTVITEGGSEAKAKVGGLMALKGSLKLAKGVSTVGTKTGSDPRSVGGWSSAKLVNRWAAHSRAMSGGGARTAEPTEE